MKTIQTTAKIGPDRRLVIDLPEEIPEGDHRVLVMVLDDAKMPEDHAEGHHEAESLLEWEDGLLVYTGEIPSDLDICRLIELDREQRMLHILIGDS